MRSFLAICGATFLLSGLSFAGLPADSAAAAEPQPTGEWRVENGLANIRIDDCDGVLWGIISWEKQPGGTDSNNPDPAMRNRSTLGLHILLAMKPTKPGLWEGEVYNAENGKTYASKISLTSPDVLRIEGCILGFLCGGENWTRVAAAPTPAQRPQAAPPPRTGKPQPVQAPMSACTGLPRGQK
jgi:uncharacterized protein (DUF2147 family)